MWKQQSYFLILPMNLKMRKQQRKGVENKPYRFPLDPMKAADAGSNPIGGGRRGRLRRSSGGRKTAERRGLARPPRRRRVLRPSAAAATLLHAQPATPQLFEPLLKRTFASTSNRDDHSIHRSSRAAAGGIQLHPMRWRPFQCSLIQILSGQSELGQGRTAKPAGDINYRLDWTGRRIWDPFPGLGIWDWVRTLEEDRGEVGGWGGIKPQSQSNPIPSSISSFLVSLRLYFLLFFPCGEDILPDLISCESNMLNS